MSAKNFRRAVTLGFGDVTRKKIKPGLDLLLDKHRLDDVLYADIVPDDSIRQMFPKINYLQTGGVDVIEQELGERGWLGEDVLALICTSTKFHVPYAVALQHSVGAIAGEKPLSLNSAEARLLLPLEHKFIAIEHQVYKRESMEFINRSRRGDVDWSAVRHATFRLQEVSNQGKRFVDDIVFDTGYHGLAMIVAALSQRVQPIIRTERSRVSRYCDDPMPRNFTAAAVEGVISGAGIEFTFELLVGKALHAERKGLTLYSENGVIADVNMEESGYEPHLRVIERVLDHGQPLLSLRDSIGIVAACEEAMGMAEIMADYEQGERLSWLESAFEPRGRRSAA